ncbi:very short patch repair endonuclease [Micromonospora endolithica]|uniref:Very short patch repair endonuclease n=1 Tax=Micromonospora endolithica TaxID=230091 RepID=A0A3A9ZDK8_9ACTN|nr:very short patch repair endonuclease [Micromonospora endolithica]RKN46353.1 very short patch repair endonuclease [Micromonospora endolithica]TWJ24910.1 T/G mismatch-specific endonuclease [Micromonospora endolithica]
MATQWRDAPPIESAWRPLKGITASERAEEQDVAAGGREKRLLLAASGRSVLASIYLRLPPKSRRVYAYLRWPEGRKTRERYVCQVSHESREENLAEAWRRALSTGLDSPRQPKKVAQSWASSPAVRSVMRANRSRDTRPELALRSAVHALGLRYRVDRQPLAGLRRKADLVFAGPRVAVFVDGCFWHGCPEHYRPSTRNSEFWSSKVEGNRQRDAETDHRLTTAGWRVIRIWEHEDTQLAAERVAQAVLAIRSPDTATTDPETTPRHR